MGRIWDALAVLLGEKPSGPVVAQLIPTWQSARPIPTKINYSAYVKEGYKGSPVIFSCIREIVGSASEPVWIMDKGEDSEPIRKHNLLTLLRRPNPEQDGVMFLAAGLTHQHIWGDWYVHKVRSRGRRVVQLWNLRPDRVEIKRDIKGAIEFYRYTVPSNTEEVGGKIGQYYDISPDDVIHMKWEEDPESDNYGLSPITILARLGDLDTSAIDYLRAFFLNQGIPAGMLKLQNRVQREERDRIKGLFKDEYQGLKSGASVAGGAGGWHGVMVLDATVEYEQIASPTEKLKLQPIFDVTEARICSVFNVPPILVGVMVGLEHSTYANYKEARRSLWEETLSPIYRKLGTAFTNGLVHEFGESEETRLLPDVSKIPALQDDKYQLSDKIVKEWEAELITRNEARAALGYDELDDAEKGDVFFSESKPKPDPMMLDEDGNPIPPKIDPKTGKPLPPKIDPKTGKPIQDPKALGDNGEPSVPSKVRVIPGGKARAALPAAAHAHYDARWQAFIDRADPLELAMTRDIAQVIASAAQDTLREVRRSRVAVATLAAVTTPEEVQRGLVKVAEKHLPQIMRAGWEYGVACMKGEHQYSRHALGEVVLDVTFDLLNPFVASYIAERPYEYALEVALSVIERMRDELVEGVEAGESVDELAHRIESFENVGSMTHARNIARTETISAMNGAALQSYKEARVVPRKRWLTARDDRVRGTRTSDKYNHVEADGQTVALDQAFVVSGEQLQYPGDGVHASIGNIAQCRCTVIPVFNEQQAWDPDEHPRHPSGDENGGEFAPKVGGAVAGSADPEWMTDRLRDAKKDIAEGPDEARQIFERLVEKHGERYALEAMASTEDWMVVWESASNEWATGQAMGGNKSLPKHTNRDSIKAADPKVIAAIKDRVLITRDLLRAEFGDKITLYRGINGSQGVKVRENTPRGGDVDLKVYGLSSFSTKQSYAADFATDPDGRRSRRGAVVRVEAKVDDVFFYSDYFVSAGHLESEVVLLTKDKTRKAKYVAEGRHDD